MTHHTFRLVAAALLLAATPAFAQDSDSGDDRWIATVGVGPLFRPAFPGARDLKLAPWPIFDLRRADAPARLETPDESFGIGLINSNRFRFGPAVNIQNGRDEEDAIIGIGDVNTTIEGGAFAEAYLTENFRLRGEVRKGFGGHKGVVGDVGPDFILGAAGDRTRLSVGPRLKLANSRYVRAFYGVNPAQSTLTGLPAYDVEGGVHSAGGLAFLTHSFNDRIGVQAYGRWDRLLGDAKDSPIVRADFGSRNQYEAGLGLSYSFDLGF